MSENPNAQRAQTRWMYHGFALAALGLGGLGVFVPLLPTTPFVLLSAWAAAKGSPRLNVWLHEHPRYGPILHTWEKERAIARRQKAQAIALIVVSWFVILWLFAGSVIPPVTAVIMGSVSIFLATRAEPNGRGVRNGPEGGGPEGSDPGHGRTARDEYHARERTFRTAVSTQHSADILGLRMPIGIGTMLWGNSRLDAKINGRVVPIDTLREIRRRALAAGVTFVDTAEGYGGGSCELQVGRAGFKPPQALIATKFLPTIWRWSERSVVRAIRRSNRRLGVRRADICFIHSPVHPRSPEVWIRGAARAVRAGLIRHIGVSNFDAEQVARAHTVAAEVGVPIIANQIMFNLLVYSARSLQATVDECRTRGIAVIGYGPVGQGLLTDGLTAERADRIRLARLAGIRCDDIAELRAKIAETAARHGRSMAQVCINWSIHKGVVPLVGTRSTAQLEDTLAATEFSLTDDEVAELDALALAHSTFDRPGRRRAFFVVFISLLMVAYRLSRIVPPAAIPSHHCSRHSARTSAETR